MSGIRNIRRVTTYDASIPYTNNVQVNGADVGAGYGVYSSGSDYCLSFNGPDFYGLPRNTSKVKLRAYRWTMEQSLPYLGDVLVPFRAGEVVEWCFDRKDSAVD